MHKIRAERPLFFYYFMKKYLKTTGYLLFTAFISSSIIFILYLRAYRINSLDNGFNRIFPSHFITDFKVLKLPFDFCYIAGVADSNIYIGKYQYPMTLLKTNYRLSYIDSFTLKYDSTRKIAWALVKVSVDSPITYLMEGLSPTIIRYNLISGNNELLAVPNYNFDICIPLSNKNLICKLFDPKTNSNILERLVPGLGIDRRLSLKRDASKADMFTSDGILNYNKATGKIVFVYFHSNEFLELDTNLKVVFKGRTIDTVAHPLIKVGYIASEHLTTYANPPLVVNRRSCISGDYLFVNSTLRANNQNKPEFSFSYTIDIYSLSNYKYVYSFYLPKYENEEMIDFRVHLSKIIAIYHHYLVIYTVNFAE